MKIKSILLLLVGIVVGAAAIYLINPKRQAPAEAVSESGEKQLYSCGMHPEVILEEPGNCPICGMKLTPIKNSGEETPLEGKGEILYWQAPMEPTEIYDSPGKSKMGMDLIPVYESQAGSSSGGSVIVDPATVQSMGIRTMKVTRGDLSREIRAVGRVDYDEEKLYTVSPKISGWIEKLYVDYTGIMVKKGDPLLEIYSPALVTAQEEYLLALENKKAVSQSDFPSIREGGESLLKSSLQRLLFWDIPQAEIDHLESTGLVRKTLRLDSPANGVVTHKNAVEGLFIKEGASIYEIADLSRVWVYASLYDYEIPWIRDGQKAEMDLSYLPGKKFTGRVSYIYPYLNEKTRDIRVRVEFPNPNLELKPGMYANIILQGKTMHDVIQAPSEAIIRSGKRNLVFVVRDKGKFEPREIQIAEEGGKNNAWVHVLSGLMEGEEVVTSAQFLLDSESRLQEAIQKMLEDKKKKAQPTTQEMSIAPQADKKENMKSDKKMDMQMDMGKEQQHNDDEMQHQQ